MDVSLGLNDRRWWWVAVAVCCCVGLLLRLKGIHAPLLDHPGWRQGDTAAIARNFAQLRYNIFFPQTEYNGAPPNYVELELQIVPFLAATLYRLFGVHEIFGRLIAIAFGVGTIAMVGVFARWLFGSAFAGIVAMALYAIFPGAIYYSRTFQPDGAMVFFFVAALYAWSRWLSSIDPSDASQTLSSRSGAAACALLAIAFLAKQVALIALVPILALVLTRFGWRGALCRPAIPIALVASLVPLALYEPYVAAHAEWHWASGIMRLHVVPSFISALVHPHALLAKMLDFARAMRMLATTMLGPVGFALLVAGFAIRPHSKVDPVLWGWLAGGVAYTYIVLTVERVDYYLYPLVPLGAIVGAGAVRTLFERFAAEPQRQRIALGALAFALFATAWLDRRLIAPYYTWSRDVYTRSLGLDRTLAPGALIVIGHYDPSLMYYIRRKGWMEDPYLWTPFDEQSAIRKGARYFIAVEPKRLARNVELAAWLQRFPLLDPAARWPVYVTDPARLLPGAEDRWREFRLREKAHALSRPSVGVTIRRS